MRLGGQSLNRIVQGATVTDVKYTRTHTPEGARSSCYRHGLEAAMKWTIEMYGTPANISVGSADMNHNLWTLWKRCKAILCAAPSSGDDAALRAVEQIVKDFHDLDKSAVAFRYSKTKSGRTILLPDKPVDLENLQQVMEAVDNFFTGTDGLLSELHHI
jgi:hypothetical protein